MHLDGSWYVRSDAAQVAPKEAEGTPKISKGSQRAKIYEYKLPINRPSGSYVNYYSNSENPSRVC